jgi:C-terminal processing protease CtpA/Prc
LADSNFTFIKTPELTSRASFVKNARFLPNRAIMVPYTFLTYFGIRKKGNKYYHSLKGAKLTPPKNNHYQGKLYVLINGASFSASSILSSNLKGSGRAIFVGEETGGTYNGTVAGFRPIVALPNSKLRLQHGLMLIQPHYSTATKGRGILPDAEVKPTLSDRVDKVDPELNWVLSDIKKHAKLPD